MKYTSSNEEDKSFYVEEGEYDLIVVDAVETVSKTSGADMIKLKLEIVDQKVVLFDYLIASESTAWKIDAFRRSLGEKVVKNEDVEINTSDLVGKKCYASLRVEEYNGKKNNKIDAWLDKPAQSVLEEKEDENEPF